MPSASSLRRACVAVALAATACGRARSIHVHDLAARAPLADRESAWEIVLFGTPRSEPVELHGFVRTPPEGGDSLAFAQREAGVRLNGARPRTASGSSTWRRPRACAARP